MQEAVEQFHAVRRSLGERNSGTHPRGDRSATEDATGEGAVAFRKLLGRLIDVCNAIEYAHCRGVVHRDIKPANIMLGKFGETLVVDWGLAKLMDGRETASTVEERPLSPASLAGSMPTMMGSAIGTPHYMSPEQAAGRLDVVGPTSDVYSLGATLYFLLTGVPPFQDQDLGTILRKVERGEFPSPRQANKATPVELEAICLKAMAKVQADRYPSARALADDIEHWLADEPVLAFPESAPRRLARWARRHRWWSITNGAAPMKAPFSRPKPGTAKRSSESGPSTRPAWRTPCGWHPRHVRCWNSSRNVVCSWQSKRFVLRLPVVSRRWRRPSKCSATPWRR
jgi:serine/threonine-protein kinase